MEYTKYREWKRRMQARQNCIYNAKARIYIQFNGKDSSDDKSVKIGYPWHRKPGWRQALQSQKVQNLSRYVLYSKTFLLCIPDSRTCSGGVFVFPYQTENSRPVLRQHRLRGVLLSLYRRGAAYCRKITVSPVQNGWHIHL